MPIYPGEGMIAAYSSPGFVVSLSRAFVPILKNCPEKWNLSWCLDYMSSTCNKWIVSLLNPSGLEEAVNLHEWMVKLSICVKSTRVNRIHTCDLDLDIYTWRTWVLNGLLTDSIYPGTSATRKGAEDRKERYGRRDTLGARDFSSAVYGFCQRSKMCRPLASTENSCRTREKPLVPRVVEGEQGTEIEGGGSDPPPPPPAHPSSQILSISQSDPIWQPGNLIYTVE